MAVGLLCDALNYARQGAFFSYPKLPIFCPILRSCCYA